MIVELVTFKNRVGISYEEEYSDAQKGAQAWLANSDLIAKHFIRDGDVGGAVYFWPSKEAAQRAHDNKWRDGGYGPHRWPRNTDCRNRRAIPVRRSAFPIRNLAVSPRFEATLIRALTTCIFHNLNLWKIPMLKLAHITPFVSGFLCRSCNHVWGGRTADGKSV
jgi:hypothetical protein